MTGGCWTRWADPEARRPCAGSGSWMLSTLCADADFTGLSGRNKPSGPRPSGSIVMAGAVADHDVAATSGAEVDDLHAPVACLRRLRRRLHQWLFLAHADRFQPARRH